MTMGWRFAVRRTILAIVTAGIVSQSGDANAQTATGEANFQRLCIACHTIGGGKRVGPDLQGVTTRRSEEWLLRWIASSQSMVRSGDPTAVALLREYNNVSMPDVALSPAEIRDVLAYIAGGPQQPAAAQLPSVPATPGEIRRGQELFEGKLRFTNGGPACSSCHHVTQDAVAGGGVLAKELTTAFTRLGSSGIRAILSSPPFPVMEQAFHARPLTDPEISALLGYLESVRGRSQYDQPREDSMKLLFGGLAGVSLLMVFYALTWRQRKKDPVNQKVFARQMSSR